jgi:hypothetical protein
LPLAQPGTPRHDSVFVGDDVEVEEMCWLTRVEVDDLVPDIYDLVRAHLDRDHRRHTG